MIDDNDQTRNVFPGVAAARALGDTRRNGSPKAKRKLRILTTFMVVVFMLPVLIGWLTSVL